MEWIVGVLVVLVIIGAFSKGGGSSGGGGGGGKKMNLPTKMAVAGVAGYALGKKLAKL